MAELETIRPMFPCANYTAPLSRKHQLRPSHIHINMPAQRNATPGPSRRLRSSTNNSTKSSLRRALASSVSPVKNRRARSPSPPPARRVMPVRGRRMVGECKASFSGWDSWPDAG